MKHVMIITLLILMDAHRVALTLDILALVLLQFALNYAGTGLLIHLKLVMTETQHRLTDALLPVLLNQVGPVRELPHLAQQIVGTALLSELKLVMI